MHILNVNRFFACSIFQRVSFRRGNYEVKLVRFYCCREISIFSGSCLVVFVESKWEIRKDSVREWFTQEETFEFSQLYIVVDSLDLSLARPRPKQENIHNRTDVDKKCGNKRERRRVELSDFPAANLFENLFFSESFSPTHCRRLL